MNLIPAIGFAQPLVLAGLVALPVIWWLLRFTPPRPRRQAFPPTRILAELVRRDETRAKSPLWLTLLRMAMAALVVLAMAGPVLNPPAAPVETDGPLVLVIDNGWASAPVHEAMLESARTAIDTADAAGQPVVLAATVPLNANDPVGPFDAAQARERLAAIEPQPVVADRMASIARLNIALADADPGSITWLSDGVENGDGSNFATALAGWPARRISPLSCRTPRRCRWCSIPRSTRPRRSTCRCARPRPRAGAPEPCARSTSRAP